MNIIDAVKSGKNFARKPQDKNDFHLNCESQEYVFDIEDILATDWEIEEKKIEITESEFDAIIAELTILNPPYSTGQIKKRLFDK